MPSPCALLPVGTLRLPLDAGQAAALRARCRPAPYRLRAETVIDPAVRNTLQLEPSEFRITNPGALAGRMWAAVRSARWSCLLVGGA